METEEWERDLITSYVNCLGWFVKCGGSLREVVMGYCTSVFLSSFSLLLLSTPPRNIRTYRYLWPFLKRR
jgi:hypothetical protein